MTNATFLSSLMHFKMTSAVMADSIAVPPTGGYKALVCLLLRDGIDSFNILTPYGTTQNDAHYSEYMRTRNGVALKRSAEWDGAWSGNDYGYLHPIIDSSSLGGTGRTFGLHPRFAHLKSMYDSGHATFVANCGALVEPILNKTEYNSVSKVKPVGLYSHPDQQRNWQTALPQSREQVFGWAGRMADLLTDRRLSAAPSNVYTTVSTAGQSILLTGNQIVPYVISPEGSIVLQGTTSTNLASDRIYSGMQSDLASHTYTNLLEKTIRDERVRARDTAAVFQEAFSNAKLPGSPAYPFPATALGADFKAIARAIKIAQTPSAPLGQQRQIFLVQHASWDHHAYLLDGQDSMIRDVDMAIKAFYDFLAAENLLDNVTTFTISDFGRTLSFNGSGTDHAWGGNTIVMGGSVNANAGNNRIWGTYPERLTDTSGTGLDLGRGTLIPQTSADVYHAELCRWFGIPNNEHLETVLPNIRNFYGSGVSSRPVGFLKS